MACVFTSMPVPLSSLANRINNADPPALVQTSNRTCFMRWTPSSCARTVGVSTSRHSLLTNGHHSFDGNNAQREPSFDQGRGSFGTVRGKIVLREGGKHIASGKQMGEFSFKAITITNSPGPAGSVLTQVNWEGPSMGFGTVFSTVTYVGGKSGTFSECAVAYLDNGEESSGLGQGTYASIAKHRWHTEDFIQLSDGHRIRSEGEIDLAARSWKGTVFEES
jgi:hypothetical protein